MFSTRLTVISSTSAFSIFDCSWTDKKRVRNKEWKHGLLHIYSRNSMCVPYKEHHVAKGCILHQNPRWEPVALANFHWYELAFSSPPEVSSSVRRTTTDNQWESGNNKWQKFTPHCSLSYLSVRFNSVVVTTIAYVHSAAVVPDGGHVCWRWNQTLFVCVCVCACDPEGAVTAR